MSVRLVPARLGHALQAARRLRPEACAHHASRRETFRVVEELMRRSTTRLAVIADGACIAVGGEIGALLGPTGQVWAVVAADAERHRFALLRAGRHALGAVLRRREALHCLLLAGDAKAMRFARLLGFEIGAVHGEGGVAMAEAWLTAPARRTA
jgi:hypothetical protein